jgi:toxin secretion/phage lysis holin
MEILKQLHFNGQWLIALPVMLMGLDILTGLMYAWTSKTFESARMRAGLGKKFGEMSYIVIGLAVTAAMSLPKYVVTGIAVYIIFMELLSIMENCDKLGAPVPAFIKNAFISADSILKNDSYTEIMGKLSKLDKAELEQLKAWLKKEG